MIVEIAKGCYYSNFYKNYRRIWKLIQKAEVVFENVVNNGGEILYVVTAYLKGENGNYMEIIASFYISGELAKISLRKVEKIK